MEGIDPSLIDDFVRRKEACKTPEELRRFLKRRPAPIAKTTPVQPPEPRVAPLEEPSVSPELVPKGTIYFILGRTANAVKIGFTAQPFDASGKLPRPAGHLRLRDIQAWSANKLEIIYTRPGNQFGGDTASGHIVSEKALHRRFKEHLLHGEWFRWCPEIEEYIEKDRNVL
jgi:hypothetical protein